MLLPDINVWLALTFDSHVHHAAATTWIESLPDVAACYFCRLSQQGFLRLATNQKAFPNAALNLSEAWQKFDLMMSDSRIDFMHEPADLKIHWRALTQSRHFSPNVWSDAYLAAFALAAGLKVITFDNDFAKYSHVSSVILK